MVRQNNAVDIYEEYFHGSGGDHSSEQPYAKTLTVFRDPCTIKRGASYISWNPDVENRKCAIAYSILGFQQQPEGMALSSYIWDVNAPNKPDFELQGPSQLCCVNYNNLVSVRTEGSSHISGYEFVNLIVIQKSQPN